MRQKKSVLVLANVTAASDELCQRLSERAEREPTAFMLVVPAASGDGGRDAAQATVDRAVGRLRESGLEVEGVVGDPEPVVAVTELWDPRRFDEVVVSTLPLGSSRWLRAGLPERIFKLTGALVTHVECAAPKPPQVITAPPRHDHSGLGPLAVLGWGGPRDRSIA